MDHMTVCLSRKRNVMYRKNVALHCGCSVPTAECLDSSTMSIAQLVRGVFEGGGGGLGPRPTTKRASHQTVHIFYR